MPKRRSAAEPVGSFTITVAPRQPSLRTRTVLERLQRDLAQSLSWTSWQPNGEALWVAVRRQVIDTLIALWRDGELVGTTPAEAFFVHCDRSTMTQNDLDNGRVIVLFGVALQRPAEFTEFRIAQQVRQPDEAPPTAAPLRARQTPTPALRGVDDGLDHRS